ncbi:hypothetical protein GALMADRAFT_224952 [Galerina marginata CBS 339.88]|uniref:Uncharacterized protein n=1 Tax=Galerina marginata (strain CBS 339.88) TaxID=685588 RepID=A0A067T3I1_GALM3|nr:hypothetical protein GALMADRAFT_224952 [Galerina marginata CBS 339.88]
MHHKHRLSLKRLRKWLYIVPLLQPFTLVLGGAYCRTCAGMKRESGGDRTVNC